MARCLRTIYAAGEYRQCTMAMGHYGQHRSFYKCEHRKSIQPCATCHTGDDVYEQTPSLGEALKQLSSLRGERKQLIEALRMLVDAEWNSDWIVKAQENARKVLEQIEK